MNTLRRAVAVVTLTAVMIAVAACGDNDATDTTLAPSGTEVEGNPMPVPGSEGVTETTVEGQPGGYSEVCAVAQELWEQDGFPTHAQLERYRAAAPTEIEDAVDLAAGRLLEADEGDMVALFNVVADDEVEAATRAINAFEEEHCGIPHGESDGQPFTTDEIEAEAQRVDVTAVDFNFEFDGTIEAGRTSFVLTNQGSQAHFLQIVRLADGVDLQAALESEDDSSFVDYWETGLAAPGGNDEEVVTIDLQPGNYGMLCWIPGADGAPHVFHGMAVPFTVSS